MTKKEARVLFGAKRKALGFAEKHDLLSGMIAQFLQLDFAKNKFLLSYKPMEKNNEVDPYYFEEIIQESNPEITICYPKANFETGQLQAYADDDKLTWENTAFGVTQPNTGTLILPEQIDLVFVPLLAFDTKGFRVGYGKGFYDRFLNLCSQNTRTIGGSFFAPIPKIDDINQWDVPLKYCVTPQQLYEF